MPERRLGPFILGEKLGGGGMGVVYSATYVKNGQVVAVKVLPPELSENRKLEARFERELSIMKRLKHPHIVSCYGGGRQGNQLYYAMERIQGGTLASLLAERGRLTWEDTVRYGIQICEALDCAHEQGIIHRDLKPANLMLTRAGALKLGDFGIAQDVAATRLTATGRTVGTYAYMAPEQISGETPVSHRTDLYALGCVLYELLTGNPPFVGDSPAALILQHLQSPPPRVLATVLDCPVWLDTLISQLLEKDPQKRPWDAATVAEALREIERKVAEHASMSLQAVKGEPTVLTTTADADELRKLLGSKKKKRKKTGPVHEQTWFLVTCLAAVLAGVTWALWPLNEEQLFAHAQKLMATEDVVAWQRAESRYLQPLQERYPSGKYATQVQEYLDKIEMQRTEERLRYSRKLGREPAVEEERLYVQARQYEQFGDRITALEKYQSLVNLLQDNPKARPFVNLARRQIAAIKASGATDDRLRVVAEALSRADEVYRRGQTLEAVKIWESIENLYANNRELEPQVKLARLKLKDPHATLEAVLPEAGAGNGPGSPRGTEGNAEEERPGVPGASREGFAAP